MNNPIKDLTKKGMAAVDKVDVAMYDISVPGIKFVLYGYSLIPGLLC